jgi:tetratricopeptide (TPR) repeat protein
VAPHVPLFGLGAGMGALTVWMEKHHVGAVGDVYDLTSVERLLIAGRALWFYAGKLVWPYPQAFFYPRWRIDPRAWWQYLFPASAVVVPIALWLARGRIGRGPLAAVLIFGGVLFPAIGFLNVYPFRFSFVADHFQYHAGVALIALAAALITQAIARASANRKELTIAASILPIGALGLLTLLRTTVFYDSETLFRDTIAKNPDSWAAYENLEGALDSQGRLADSLQVARDALARAQLTARADDPTTTGSLAMAHNNLGACLLKQGNAEGFRLGQIEEVMFELREALRLDPKLTKTYCNLASVLLGSDRPAEALKEANLALAISPRDADPWYVKGMALDALGKPTEAEACFEKAIELNPDFAQAHTKLALLLLKQQRPDEATSHLESALRLDSGIADAHYALAGILANRGDFLRAAQHFAATAELRPGDANALNYLGVALVNLGQTDKAIQAFEEALRRSPTHAEAKANLKQALEIKRSEPVAPPPSRQ